MIPLKLTIKGIYSYIEEQTINFDQLTDSGIFGIFGGVGSGKSTILEAITFALYNDTERLNSRDSRNYNMMNLKSNDLLIDFEFYTESKDIKYRFIVKSKRNKNKFEDVSIKDRSTLISENGGDWIPTDKNAEDIIGLSYKNFKRTIIIPQGKFKEFLELGAKDRTEMLNEIFHLQKFDLAPKLGSVKKENDDTMILIEGEMKQYELLTSEMLDELVTQQKSLSKLEEQETKLVNDLRKKIEDQKQLEKLFENIKKVELKLKEQKELKPSFDTRQVELNKYNFCKINFQEEINSSTRLKKEIEKSEDKLSELLKSIESKEKANDRVEAKIKAIQETYNNREKLKKEADELNVIIKTRELNTEEETLAGRVEKGRSIVDIQKEELSEYKNKLKSKKDDVIELKKGLANISELYRVKGYYEKQNSLNKDITILKDNLGKEKIATSDIQNQIKEVFSSEYYSDKTSEIKEKLNTEIDKLENDKQILNEEINHILAQQKLKQWADDLEEGKSCPVCGSTEHPNVLNLVDLQNDILEINKNTKQLDESISKLRKQQQELSTLDANLESSIRLVKSTEQKQEDKNEELKNHEKSFVWDNYKNATLDEVIIFIEASEGAIKKINTAEQNITEIDDLISTLIKKIEDNEKGIQKLLGEQIGLNTTVRINVESLTIFSIKDFKDETNETINKLAIEKINTANEVTEIFEKLTKQNNELIGEIAGFKGEISQLKKGLKENIEEFNTTNKHLVSSLEKSEYESLDSIKSILSKDIDIQNESKIIADYYNNLETTSEELKKLDKESEGKIFNSVNLEKDTETISQKEADLKKTTSQLGVITSEITTLEKNLKNKKDLEKKNENLLKRKENIALLFNLFKAKGFVNYISTVYLQNLSESANDRFFKMTKQHLQLEITDGNEFQIRDYLNEGKTRSVKTLSGGQMFQASLSLALALADSVQSQIKANNNFFFLDEGFGSLDDESLHIVFETLKSLKNENRIVGVISHVESLKQEIDVHLQVIKNEEKGSLINYSWK